jgi:hypothetical protein
MDMKTGILLLAGLLALPRATRADDPPVIDHQPAPCTVPEKAISLCASVSDDNQVATARIYFRRAGEDFYQFVDMAFAGVSYCGTVPAPREGKVKTIEYYLQAVDDQFQPTRTSTFNMNVQPEGVCEFPPLEKDARKAAAIKVFATNRKQGTKLDASFVLTGVTFVPVGGRP